MELRLLLGEIFDATCVMDCGKKDMVWYTHTQLWNNDWSGFDSIFWFLTKVLFECLDDFTGFDLNFQPDMIFLSLELLGTSNKLVGGCDKCMKMHFC